MKFSALMLCASVLLATGVCRVLFRSRPVGLLMLSVQAGLLFQLLFLDSLHRLGAAAFFVALLCIGWVFLCCFCFYFVAQVAPLVRHRILGNVIDLVFYLVILIVDSEINF